MGVFLAICGRAFALQSRFGVAAGAATRALRCAHCDARDFLQRHRCAIAIGVYASLWWTLVAKNRFRFVPRKRKRPVRTSGPKRELEARRGTGPHTRRGCTVLDLGRCTGTYCFGVAGKLGRGPRVCRQKYRYGFSRSCETVLNDLCTQGTWARQDVKGLMGAIKQHLT